MTKRNYPRLRNGKLKGGGFGMFPHIVVEEDKTVWVFVQSSITAMGISAWKKRFYPDYECHIPSPSYWEELQKKYG
tara:strand:+ start:149 stop:376 length:228 start_codon:yes stop_codon:yes gene_type:complete